MVEVIGKHGYVARILCDSVNPSGKRIVTFELEYWRGIHQEFLTHCMLSRNSASSRAIPFTKMVDQLGARPIRFGQANPGMQDRGVEYAAPIHVPQELYDAAEEFLDAEHDSAFLDLYWNPGTCKYEFSPELWWEFSEWLARKVAQGYYDAGYHKQIINRPVEPYQFMKTVATATEWNNFFHLRIDGAADPSIFELARIMKEAFDKSVPFKLYPGEYHLPYVNRTRINGGIHYWIDGENQFADEHWLTLDEALKVSSARTAAVSFRNTDYGVEKSSEVYSRLIGDERIHGSACEHQATPMQKCDGETVNIPQCFETWEPGVTHVDRNEKLWSAKFQGWVMHRKLIPGENKEG